MSKYKPGEALPLEEGLYTHINPIIGPFLHEKLGLTPNGITTISLFVAFYIAYSIYIGNYKTAAVLVLVRQVLDSTDGYIARRYGIESEFGAKYDMMVDYIHIFLMNSMLLYKLMGNVPVIVTLIILKLYMDIGSGDRIECLKRNGVCKDEKMRHEILKHTKRFSPFEYTLLEALLIFNLKYFLTSY